MPEIKDGEMFFDVSSDTLNEIRWHHNDWWIFRWIPHNWEWAAIRRATDDDLKKITTGDKCEIRLGD